MRLVGDTADNLFLWACAHLENKSIVVRDLLTWELINVTFELNNPAKCIVINKERKLSLDYLAAEIKWYLSGSLYIDEIAKHSSFWKKLAEHNMVNSNYPKFGICIFI